MLNPLPKLRFRLRKTEDLASVTPQPSALVGLKPSKVAFNKPAFIGTELQEVQNAILKHQYISGVGFYTHACEAFLSDFYQAPTLLTTSCTHALEMAAMLLNLAPEDEVILPSYTFVSTANAFLRQGCQLRFADCDETGQLLLSSVESLLTPKTKVVCVVHYGGNATDMEALSQFCEAHRLILVEDAAQAIGARDHGKLLGTWGDIGCLSFHETKNVTAGEGGAIILNTPALADRAHILREKGTNRKQFFQGLVDKYTWVDIGSSYVLSDMNAAYLWVQLQHLEAIHQKRQQLWEKYYQTLTPLLSQLQAEVLEIPAGNTPNYHLFALVFHQAADRLAFIDFMKARSITTPFHYVALHQSPMGAQFPAAHSMSGTLRLSECLVRLPLFYNMTDLEQETVLLAVQEFIQSREAH